MNPRLLFEIGDRVTIEGDTEIIAVVTAYLIRGINHHIEVEIAYTHNGQVYKPWIPEERLLKWVE